MTGPPIWDVDAYIHAKTEMEVPVACAEGKVRIQVFADGSWNVVVRRDEDTFSLLLRGQPESRTTATLREVFGFCFGRSA